MPLSAGLLADMWPHIRDIGIHVNRRLYTLVLFVDENNKSVFYLTGAGIAGATIPLILVGFVKAEALLKPITNALRNYYVH